MIYLIPVFCILCTKCRTRPVNSLRQSKLRPQCITKALNRLSDLVCTGSRKSSPEEHLLFGSCAVSLEPAAAGDETAMVHAGQEDLLFDGVAGLAGCNGRVFLPVDFDPVLFCQCLVILKNRLKRENVQTCPPQEAPSGQSPWEGISHTR